MIITSLFATKLIFAASKDMVNVELTKKVALNLFRLGKSTLVSSIYNDKVTHDQSQSESSKTKQRDDAISTEYLVYNWLEAWFAWFQMIAIWQEPILSLLVTCGLLISFLLFTYFAPRFYATIMILLFVYNLTRVWFRHVWPEIRVPPENEDETRLDVDRSRDRVQFCITICSILTCTAYIGSRISGLTLIFSAVALALVGPGIYLHTLPNQLRDYLRTIVSKYILRTTVESSRQEGEPISSPESASKYQEFIRNHPCVNPAARAKWIDDLFQLLTGRAGSEPANSSTTTTTTTTDNAIPQTSDDNIVSQEIDNDTNLRKVSSDEGSSASLIDFDDEQQDGFVIL